MDSNSDTLKFSFDKNLTFLPKKRKICLINLNSQPFILDIHSDKCIFIAKYCQFLAVLLNISIRKKTFISDKKEYMNMKNTSVPNFEIVWPTPATPRALTVKGVYVVSHSCYEQLYEPVCIFKESFLFFCRRLIFLYVVKS